jgi:hypothetical protein
MEKFGWKTITVIKDQVSQSPIASKIGSICLHFIDVLQAQAGKIDSLIVNTDSTFENASRPLLVAQNFSRSEHYVSYKNMARHAIWIL